MNTHTDTAEFRSTDVIDLGAVTVETQGAQNTGFDNGVQLKGMNEGLTED